jgi:ribonuclease E
VSSVALQHQRAIEETLLKGPTHNLIVRTRPDIALYVLNHKRAHLRGLEERFHVALTVNADEEVGGQVGFTIDRGEQVMSVEQAKAVLAQQANLAPPTLIEEEEPVVEEEFEDEAEAETSSEERGHAGVTEIDEDRQETPDGESFQPSDGEDSRESGDMPRDGGRGRRRRRRRGRGGRGEGREAGQPRQPRHEGGYEQGAEQAYAQEHAQQHTAEQHGGFAPDHSGGPQPDYAPPPYGQQEGGEALPQGMPPERFGEGHHEGGERHENGDGRARRRRGRRGGRRNRRGREGHEGDQGEFASAPSQEPDLAPSQAPGQTLGQDMQYEIHSRPDMDERPQWSPPRETATPEPSHTPKPEPVAEAAPAPQSEPEPAAPPRRRSTVREPAPTFRSSEPVVTPMPAPQPASPPPEASAESASADDPTKPRRTGWWAKRLLGGDKG